MAKQTGKSIGQHTHKLRRHRYSSGNITYFCALPDCSYKIMPALALGKRTICWRCGEPFILSDYAIRLAKPHCENCHKPKILEQLDVERVQSFDKASEDAEVIASAVTAIATDSISNLRSRLSSVLKHAAEEEDEI